MAGRDVPVTGCVVWITGLPASGKTTLANAVAAAIRRSGAAALVLDGDEVRAAMHPPLGYGDEDRDQFYRTLSELAALAASQGLIVLVAATANRRVHRDWARELAPAFVEVLVDVPAEECARRDQKGLYAMAREGRAPTLPGPGAKYEPPRKPDVVARGGQDPQAVEAVIRAIASRRAES